MAEAVASSCPAFSGDERSLFATLSGVVAVLMIYLAQAADLMNGSLFTQVFNIRIRYFQKIFPAMTVPGLGAMAAFSSSVNTWKTIWRLKRKKFWQGEPLEASSGNNGSVNSWETILRLNRKKFLQDEPLEASRGSNGSKLYWDPRSLKVLMVADIWIGYTVAEEDLEFVNREIESVSSAIEGIGSVMEMMQSAIFEITIGAQKPDINNGIDSSPSPPKAREPVKSQRLKDVEATHPLKVEGKEMLCYKFSASLSIKDGGSSHAPAEAAGGNVNEHIVSMLECSTNNNDDSTKVPVIFHRVTFLRDRTEKQALLQLGFVPEYEELSYLRTNTSWGMMLLGLQTLGFIVSGTIRIFEDRIMSPIEVVAMFLSCVSLLQVLFQMIGSISTQRAVLINLTPAEFSSFQQQVKHIQDTEKDKEEKEPLFRRALYIVGYLIILICTSWLPSSMLFRYASYFKKAAHHSRVCYASAVCFAVILLLPPVRHLQFLNMWFISPWMSLATLALAAAGTIKEWKNLCFNEPSAEWYSLLIPHVGNF